MRLLVQHATTGETVIDEMHYDYFRMRGWELLLKLKRATHSASPFEWRILAKDQELDPAATLGQYETDQGICFQCIKQALTAATREECHDLIAILVHRERRKLWDFLQRGKTIPGTIWREFGTVNPLIIAINANEKETYDEIEVEEPWPDTALALLLAGCDPNATGDADMTPLCQAIRASDCRAVGQLLAFRADPCLCEKGGPQPIFWAIRVASAEYVQQLLDSRADALATEVIYMEDNVQRLLAYNVDPTAAGTAASDAAGSTAVLTRTTLEAAASMPRILHVLREALAPSCSQSASDIHGSQY